MKPPKFLISVAAAVCAFAICDTDAQTTNVVTFKTTMTSQGAVVTNFQGTNISFAVQKPKGFDTADLIHELELSTSNTNLSKATKLEIINGDSPAFALADGTNVILIDPRIISLNLPSTNSVQSGVQNGDTFLSFRTLKQLVIIELDLNDVGLGASDLNFSMRGLASGTTSDTIPSTNGVYTETFSAKISDMTGSGTEGPTPFVITGSLSASGKGVLSL